MALTMCSVKISAPTSMVDHCRMSSIGNAAISAGVRIESALSARGDTSTNSSPAVIWILPMFPAPAIRRDWGQVETISAPLARSLFESSAQALRQFDRIVVGPEMHEDQSRLFAQHVAVNGRYLDAIAAQCAHDGLRRCPAGRWRIERR